MKILFALLLTAVSLMAQSKPGVVSRTLTEMKDDQTQWKASLIAVAVSSAFELHSEYRLVEPRRLVAADYSEVRNKAIGTAAGIALQILVVHKWPSTAKVFRWVNFGYASYQTVHAIQNYGTQPRRGVVVSQPTSDDNGVVRRQSMTIPKGR